MIWINSVSWKKILAELMANVDVVKITVISCFFGQHLLSRISQEKAETVSDAGFAVSVCADVISCTREPVLASLNFWTPAVFQMPLISKDTICKMSMGLICNEWTRANDLITSCYWKSIVYKLQRKLAECDVLVVYKCFSGCFDLLILVLNARLCHVE